MKKILFFPVLLLIVVGATAQDQRTTSTRIADLLAQLPATNEANLQTAMKEMERLGADGLFQLSQQLIPDGKADNSRHEYAIMGYTAWVSAPGRQNLKNQAEDAWLKALSEHKDKNVKSFFMNMLELVGTDKSVPALSQYLADDTLGKQAARVLGAIGTDAAAHSLLAALNDGRVINKIPALQALGYMQHSPAVEQISQFATSGKPQESAAAITALAAIGDPASQQLLFSQTKSGGKNFENKNATAVYASFIRRLYDRGMKAEAKKLASDFVKQTAKSNTLARIAAIDLLTQVYGADALPALAKAAYDPDLEYRNAALFHARPFINSSNQQLFTKGLKKASPAVQASIVGTLGYLQDPQLLKLIAGFANSPNDELRHSAISALAQSGSPGATAQLLTLLKKNNKSDAQAIKQALLFAKDEDLTRRVRDALPSANGYQKAVLIGVLAARKDKEAFELVRADLNSSDKEIREAALTALPEVSSAATLDKQFEMLRTGSDEKDIAAIQKAISASLRNAPNAEEIVMSRLDRFPDQKITLLFPALSSMGSERAMQVVYNAYKNGDVQNAKQALQALARWPNDRAMDALFSIASSDPDAANKQTALSSYIGLIKKVNAPEEQKLLLLKKAMSLAVNPKEKKAILQQVSQINSFPALAFAARYLDDEAVQQEAAGAVMNIGLSDKSFYGTLVRNWLTKAMNVLEGQDAVYMKKSIQKFLDDMPDREGYVSLFNGKDLSGWKGLVDNPIKRSKMSPAQLRIAQEKADAMMRNGWVAKDGELIFTGQGDNIATVKKYGDIEMLIDWKIFDDGHKDGDAGIYLRGTPQVQIWDTSRTNVGAQVGSGGLYNNIKHESKPLKVADNKLGEWNHFYIKMIGDRVTVYLNGELVTDNVPLENYWDRNMPLWPEEQIELQAHGSRIGYRDIYVKEIESEAPFTLSDEEKQEGFKVLFDGTDLDHWQGNLTDYVIEDGELVVRPKPGSHGNLYTKEEYGDFIFRFEFKLTPGANNGLGIRAPLEGDAAYAGMEIQILDDDADIYKNLEKYQYHGSVYGVIPAKRGFLKPVGEWNYEEVIVKGPKIKVILNGETIVDGDLTEARKKGTLDKQKHPGIFNEKGYIGFLGHGSVVHFRNIRVKEL